VALRSKAIRNQPFEFGFSIESIWLVGATPNSQNVMGGFGVDRSHSVHTQRVSKFWKKFLKKVLESIKIILYLWGGGWAWSFI
jgi:hypothetical protein